jgi:DOPA 4,5-dioxygenase
MREARDIVGYHAHVYFDATTREAAAGLREAVGARFTVELGTWHERPVGPHPVWSYQIAFATAQFGEVVPWLMLHRGELNVLVHPRTGDEVADHTAHASWLGAPVALDIEFLRREG